MRDERRCRHCKPREETDEELHHYLRLDFGRRSAKHGGKFLRYESTAIWATDIDGSKPHRLTRWRNGLDQVPSSFSPDGQTLAITRIDERRSGKPEAVLWRLGTGHRRLLAPNAREPVFSPDGSKIGLVHQQTIRPARRSRRVEETAGLYIVNRDGSGLRRLTNTSHHLVGSPSWDPSGERLAYSQVGGGRSGLSTTIMEMNADGSCRRKVLGETATVLFAAIWQPGPGREAGRIECE